VSRSAESGLRQAALDAANQKAIETGVNLLPDVMKRQRGGVLLHLNKAVWSNSWAMQKLDGRTATALSAWTYWSDLKVFGTVRSFALSGIVKERSKAADGTPLLDLTLDEYPLEGSAALVYSVWCGLALAFMCICFSVFIWRAKSAWTRDTQLQADLLKRSAAGEPSVF
jgi:hypothetical protein